MSERIAQGGPLPFSAFQELALYHPQAGFYAGWGGAGRAGDFITSPEVGGLFGAVVSMALDKWWRRLGHPEPFFVVEVGAGNGTLAASIIEAEPACASSLRYITVERSVDLRMAQYERLSIVDAESVLDALVKKGPLVTNLSELPPGPLTGIVLANELLDNLPVDLFERRGGRWLEVCIGLDAEGGLSETLVPPSDDTQQLLSALAPGAAGGARIPLQRAAMAWLEQALNLLDRGRVVVFDYVRTTRWMSANDWHDWLRTYRNQRPGGPPLEGPGSQDITCEVAIDQLASVRPPDRDRTQGEFLDAHGLAVLMSDAREIWHSRAVAGDLKGMRARARVQEGRELTDAHGLGRFRALEWEVPAPKKRPAETLEYPDE